MARDKMITIRVDEAERSLFKGAAQAVGISISEYARDAMLARMALEGYRGPAGFVAAVDEVAETVTRTAADMSPRVIESPGDVPAAVERVVSVSPQARVFSPDPKVKKTAKPVVTASTCRHGLMQCKVCGSG